MDWPQTGVTTLLKIALPIIQAPMAGGISTPALIAAVSNAGGLGCLGAGYQTPEDIEKIIREIRQLTDKPFAVNLFVPEKHAASKAQIESARKAVQSVSAELNFTLPDIAPPYAPSFDAQMAILLKEKVPIVSFTFGIPARKWIDSCKQQGIILMANATTVEEAVALQKNHMDAIVVQGREAGGHRGTFLGKPEDALVPLAELLPRIAEKVRLVLIAAGGIMKAQQIAELMQAGAAAVQMGTAFICCPESGALPAYKSALLETRRDATVLTRAFSGRLARGLNNTFIERMAAYEKTILDYPIQHALTAPLRKWAGQHHQPGFMSLFAGQGLADCQALPAAQLIETLDDEMRRMV